MKATSGRQSLLAMSDRHVPADAQLAVSGSRLPIAQPAARACVCAPELFVCLVGVFVG
jgi:hypothetical protein